jgi:UDP-N-acetylglucosamine transferase subunit ALG13
MSSEENRGGAGAGGRVFVTVGTDHHPFDRLIEWVDEWLAADPVRDVECLAQIGTSAPTQRGRSRDYLTYPEMEAALRRASAVVCHAGPGTIMLAMAAGKRPIVVPRRSALGEHVDDHQLVFARRVGEHGTIWLAETKERFHQLLDLAVGDPGRMRAARRARTEATAVGRVERLVADLVNGSRAA